MNNWKITLLVPLFVSIFCISSCDKYDSKIMGKVVYTEENIDYSAGGAVVAKMVQKGDSLKFVSAVFADISGEFLFDHTTKGTWILSGKFEKDSITTYFGLSENFTTNGEDNVEITIKLTPIIKEDME